ncbi:hypothetical protein J5N97_011447 [Dioscorea zingiberensis]|uniref:Uncharacterized protein n=1 Tax=Dioscorea zingiberensis TaxID=325984 RepID=A0A9D5HPK9_9LILI|nr:hypothetical protein J5N97_011447 [Dioscorea zingiberensis]
MLGSSGKENGLRRKVISDVSDAAKVDGENAKVDYSKHGNGVIIRSRMLRVSWIPGLIRSGRQAPDPKYPLRCCSW